MMHSRSDQLPTGWHSIKTRTTMVATVALLIGMWALVIAVNHQQKQTLQDIVGEQQFATASVAANTLDQELRLRKSALETVAEQLEKGWPHAASDLSHVLCGRVVLLQLFSGGIYITDAKGTIQASCPANLSRVGLNVGDREYIRIPLTLGKSHVGPPVIGKALGEKVLGMAAALRDGKGQIVGTVAGVIKLDQANFLDNLESHSLPSGATYLVVSPAHRQIIMASDKSRIMEVLPAAGSSPALDRFINGKEGNAEFINPLGIEVLASVKRIPSTDWYAAIATPASQAYAPVQRMQREIITHAIWITALVIGLLWWWLRRELTPLQKTAQALMRLTPQDEQWKPLAIERRDEVGMVLQGFNQLLEQLRQRQQQLSESEDTYRTAFAVSPDALSISRLTDGTLLEINDGFTKLLGFSREEILKQTSVHMGIWLKAEDRLAFARLIQEHGKCSGIEVRLRTKTGRIIPVELSASRLDIQGKPCILTICHDLSPQQAAQNAIRQLTEFDPLTLLPNRKHITQALSRLLDEARSDDQKGAVLCVDIDDFKTLNELHGHEVGDQFLRTLAQRMRSLLPSTDLLGRFGGDEFMVILPRLSNDEGKTRSIAEATARALLQAANEPVTLDNAQYQRSLSIGVAVFDGNDTNSAEPIQRADLAAHQAKANSRNSIAVYQPEMLTVLSNRSSLEERLRKALQEQRLEIHYQPQVTAKGQIIGAEALLRWHDATQGWIEPYKFIPVAEATGLIVPLSQWMVHQICTLLANWAHDPLKKQLTLSVNISSQQFAHPSFVQDVLAELQNCNTPADRLKLEITESALIQDMEGTVRKMQMLREAGVRFALDDFGTGYSSLAYLKQLPLDQLKVDKSFVHNVLTDPHDAAITQMVITLGNTLALDVLAEGIEDQDQWQRLQGMGCSSYQGDFFGAPVPLEQFVDLLQ